MSMTENRTKLFELLSSSSMIQRNCVLNQDYWVVHNVVLFYALPTFCEVYFTYLSDLVATLSNIRFSRVL